MVLLSVLLIGSVVVSLACEISYPHAATPDRCRLLQGPHECIEASRCRSTASALAMGRKPTICGWNKNVPKVCCNQIIEGKQTNMGIQLTTITARHSPISPKGCGVRYEPPTKANSEETYSLNLPNPDDYDSPLEGGIQRRSAKSPSLLLNEDEGSSGIFVVGGEEATLEWSWMVAIFRGSSRTAMCGGVLIDDRHILTAAHCFAESSRAPKDYTVLVGQLTLISDLQKVPIKALQVHENYEPEFYYNDIAILTLASPLPGATPACIPAVDNLKPGDTGTLMGWGDLSFGGSSSAVLQEVRGLPIIFHDQCNSQYRSVSSEVLPGGITDSFLCAGLEDGGKDACQGDSGGPLLHQDSESKVWSAVGIVSFGYGCAEPGYPGVYTRISAFASWIEEYIEKQKKRDDYDEVVPFVPRPVYVTIG